MSRYLGEWHCANCGCEKELDSGKAPRICDGCMAIDGGWLTPEEHHEQGSRLYPAQAAPQQEKPGEGKP